MDVTHPLGSMAAARSLRSGLGSAERDHGVIARRANAQFSFPEESDCIEPHRSGTRLARPGGWMGASNIRVSEPLSTVNRKNPYSWFDWWRVVDGRHVRWIDSPRPCLTSTDEELAVAPVVQTPFASAVPPTAVGSGVPTECRSCVTPGIPAPLLAVSVAGNCMSVAAVSQTAWLEAPAKESICQQSARSKRRQPSDPRSRLPGCASAV